MTAFVIFASLFNVGATLAAAALIWTRRQRDERSRRLVLESLLICGWSACYVVWQQASDPAEAMRWLRVLSAFAVTIPVAFFLLVCALVRRPAGREARIYALVTLPLVALSFTEHVVEGVRPLMGVTHWPVAGDLYWLYLLVFGGVAIRANVLLVRHYLQARGRERNQLSYIVLSAAVGFVGGASNFPGWYGLALPPIGTPLVGLHMLGVCYSVIRFNLLPFNLVVARVIAFFVVPAAFLFAGYGLHSALLPWVGERFEWVTLLFTSYLSLLGAYHVGGTLRRDLEAYLERRVVPQVVERRAALTALGRRLWLSPNEDEVFTHLIAGLREVFKGGAFGLQVRREGGDGWLLHAESDAVFRADVPPGELPRYPETPALLRFELGDPAEAGAALGLLLLRIPEEVGFLTDADAWQVARLAEEAGLVVRTKRIERRASETEKMISLGTLAAGIAHEFRNPLASIRVFVDLVGLRKGARALALQEQVADDITRLDALISNILALSKGARTGFEALDLREVVRQAVGSVVANYGAATEWFEIGLPAGRPVRVRGSNPELVQVFTNLFTNAIDAVRGMTEERTPRIQVRFQVGAVVRVTITDNGPGIPPEELGWIWDAFHSTKAPVNSGAAVGSGGLGLGLAFVKVVLGLHHAQVFARNEAGGGGAEFVVEIPVAGDVEPSSD